MSRAGVISKFLKHFILILIPAVIFAGLTEFLTQPEAIRTGWFWLSVMVNISIIILVVFLAWWLAGGFNRRVYEAGSVVEGLTLLMRRRFGKMGFRPIVLLRQGRVAMDRHNILRYGGPATLIVHNDTAVVLEKAGRLTRVVGSGFPSIESFENIYDIVDLRPKSWCLSVGAMTKEGIPVTWDVKICYQLNDGGQKPTDKVPYPYVEDDVFRAATATWHREQGRLQEMDWEGWIVISQTEGALRAILARRRLDELIGLTEADQLAIRQDIQSELEQALDQAAPKVGAKILEIKLDNLKVNDEVTQQWIENWRSRWHSWSINQLSKGEAESIEAFESADAEAYLTPLNLLTKEIQELADSGQDINSIISMRLIAALAQARFENEVFAPSEALDALKKFQDLLDGGTETPELAADNQKSMPAPKQLPVRSIPLLGPVAAGQARPATDDVLGEIVQLGDDEFEFEEQPLTIKQVCKGGHLKFIDEFRYVAVPVTGDSMDRAGILPDDYAILQTSHLLPARPEAGDIVAVVFRDKDDNVQATLKRIHFEDNTVVLQPESSNPVHEPRVLPKDAFAGENPVVTVTGIVTAILGQREKPFG